LAFYQVKLLYQHYDIFSASVALPMALYKYVYDYNGGTGV